MEIEKVNVLGVGISVLDQDRAREFPFDAVRNGKRGYVTITNFFWVGIGMPKQEKFMAEYISILPEAKIFIGVGAAFDFFTGRVRQAPRWMMPIGLEWLFRLFQEPTRLWRRYLIYNPLFVIRAAGQLLGLRKQLRV